MVQELALLVLSVLEVKNIRLNVKTI